MIHLNDKSFLGKGYAKFENKTKYRDADYLLQKRVRDGDGNTKYFITVYAHDLNKYGNDIVGYTATATYYENPEDDTWSFSVDIFIPDVDNGIEGTEERFERLYKHFGEVLDIHNN